MTALAWYDDLAEATQHVPVDDTVTHHITWRHGKLILDHHDIEAEQALIALGGERCPCLDVGELFQTPPPLYDVVKANTPRSASARRGTRYSAQSTFQRLSHSVPQQRHVQLRKTLEEHAARERMLTALRLLDGELRRRLLCASAIAATRRGVGGYPDDSIGLTRFFADEIAPAVEWSLRGARRNLPPGAKIDFHLRLLANDDDSPRVEGVVSRGGGSVSIALQPRWLADVWAHGLTLVDDNPVVAMKERNSLDSAWVIAICWSRARFELTEPRLEPMFVTRDEVGFWHSATDRPPR